MPKPVTRQRVFFVAAATAAAGAAVVPLREWAKLLGNLRRGDLSAGPADENRLIPFLGVTLALLAGTLALPLLRKLSLPRARLTACALAVLVFVGASLGVEAACAKQWTLPRQPAAAEGAASENTQHEDTLAGQGLTSLDQAGQLSVFPESAGETPFGPTREFSRADFPYQAGAYVRIYFGGETGDNVEAVALPDGEPDGALFYTRDGRRVYDWASRLSKEDYMRAMLSRAPWPLYADEEGRASYFATLITGEELEGLEPIVPPQRDSKSPADFQEGELVLLNIGGEEVAAVALGGEEPDGSVYLTGDGRRVYHWEKLVVRNPYRVMDARAPWPVYGYSQEPVELVRALTREEILELDPIQFVRQALEREAGRLEQLADRSLSARLNLDSDTTQAPADPRQLARLEGAAAGRTQLFYTIRPVVKIHYYVFSLVLVLAVLGALYSIAAALGGKGPAWGLLALQTAATLCYGAAYLGVRTMEYVHRGQRLVTPASAVGATTCIVLAAIAAGLFAGLVSRRRWVPPLASVLTSTLLYFGEYMMLGGFYRFGGGVLLGGLPLIGLTALHLLGLLLPAALVALALKLVNKGEHSRA